MKERTIQRQAEAPKKCHEGPSLIHIYAQPKHETNQAAKRGLTNLQKIRMIEENHRQRDRAIDGVISISVDIVGNRVLVATRAPVPYARLRN